MSPLVKTKVVLPTKPSMLLHRPRLVDFIHEHIDRKLILVSAAAGYGKTSLLVDFAYDTDVPVCWYSLDPSDADVRIFLEHLAASIARRFPQINQGPLGALLRGQMEAPDPQGLLTLLVNEVQDSIAEYFVLVLDDYHFADASDDVKLAVEWLLDHSPDNCCFLLSSRTMPRLPILQLTARREVAGLGNDDLRFNAQEIRELLAANYSIFVPEDEAERLAAESEGWITGILLTTHTLWKGLLQTIIRVKGSGEQVYAYLAEEVFEQQPMEIQEFLKASSILTVMDVDLCNEVLGVENSPEMLDLVEARNLFVSKLEEETTCYKYHHLFRGFLISRFVPSEQARMRELHQRAGHTLEERGGLNEAVSHYLSAEAYGEAARVMDTSAAQMFNAGKLRTLAEWIDSLPAEERRAHPNTQLIRGRIHVEKGDLTRAQKVFANVYQQFIEAGDLGGQARALVQLASTHRFQGRYDEAIQKSKEVLALASQGELDRQTVAEAYRTHGLCLAYVGNLQQAEAELSKSLALYKEIGDIANVANLYQGIGMVIRRAGRLAEGEQYYREALSIWQKLQNSTRIAEVLNNIAMVHYYRGEYATALELLQDALDKVQQAGHRRIEGVVLTSLGDVHLDLDEYGRTEQYYVEAAEAAQDAQQGFFLLYSLARLGEVYSLGKKWDKARSALEQASNLVKAQGGAFNKGLVNLSAGILCYLLGETEKGIESLRLACESFEEVKANHELARAQFHLAYGFYLTNKWQEAMASLRTSIDLSARSGYDQFFMTDGKRMGKFLRQAAREDEVGEKVASILRRIDELSYPIRPKRPHRPLPVVPYVEIYAFGRSRVIVDGKPTKESDWGGTLTKGLFFYILEQGPRVKEELGGVFWPDYSPAKMSSSFHAAMYRVRRVVGRDLVVYDDDSRTYLINGTHDYFYDVEEFEELFHEAMKQMLSNQGEAVRLLEKALGLYRGDYFRDSYSDWCLQRREELRRICVEGLVSLAALKERDECYQESIRLYQRALKEDPFQEEIHQRLMRCYVLAGQRPTAIRHYNSFANLLKAEMGLSPIEETTALYREILNQA